MDFKAAPASTPAVAEAKHQVLLPLTVRTLGGQEFKCEDVDIDCPVRGVKTNVAGMIKVPDFSLRLLLDGTILDDGATLRSAGVVPEGGAVDLIAMRVPGTDSDYKSLLGRFSQAVEKNRIEEARQLLDQGAGHNAEGELLLQNGSSILHLAVRGHMTDLAVYLVSRGVDHEAINEAGRTPLVQAAIKGLPRVVDVLLEARADPNHKDRSGKSALQYATQRRQHDVAKKLLQAGAHEDGLTLDEREWVQTGVEATIDIPLPPSRLHWAKCLVM
eukprot:TRINITY_DN58734_c0_g1_i1.p1 TRINITY_DN58734_c0_g1~~TRINITY_DN58734_c0_g1_i1.p1  ORF type:complete len:294 (-),score=47.04 TRINITY_DN58734_c0_g1_i1:107-925(-)